MTDRTYQIGETELREMLGKAYDHGWRVPSSPGSAYRDRYVLTVLTAISESAQSKSVAAEQRIAQLEAELKAIKEARERIHARFRNEARIDGECQCPYCQGDAEALAEMAAHYEMDLHSADQRQQVLRAKITQLEAQIAEAREACPRVRMQDHRDDSLLKLVEGEVALSINREVQAMRLRDLVFKLEAELKEERSDFTAFAEHHKATEKAHARAEREREALNEAVSEAISEAIKDRDYYEGKEREALAESARLELELQDTEVAVIRGNERIQALREVLRQIATGDFHYQLDEKRVAAEALGSTVEALEAELHRTAIPDELLTAPAATEQEPASGVVSPQGRHHSHQAARGTRRVSLLLAHVPGSTAPHGRTASGLREDGRRCAHSVRSDGDNGYQ